MQDNPSSRRFFLAGALALSAAPAAESPVRKKKLGRTGFEVTTVSYGTMITSDASVIERAADMGINYFDTARGYQSGNCERMVGAALKSRRQSVYISTKSNKEDKEGSLAELETSLRELQTDYIDIWYLHAKSRGSQLPAERLEAQRIAKQKGMVRFTGVSTHAGFADVIPAAIKCGEFDVILSSYNFTMGREIDPLLAQAKQAGLGVVAMKVMAGGFRRAKPGDRNYQTLKKEGAFPAALRWALRSPHIDTTIPSITDHDQLDENFRCMGAPFSAADEQTLALQRELIRPLYCHACGVCVDSCRHNLPVPDLLRYVMYAEGYGEFPLAREHYRALPAGIQQVRCADCARCTVRCPNGVDVAARLSRAQELLA